MSDSTPSKYPHKQPFNIASPNKTSKKGWWKPEVQEQRKKQAGQKEK